MRVTGLAALLVACSTLVVAGCSAPSDPGAAPAAPSDSPSETSSDTPSATPSESTTEEPDEEPGGQRRDPEDRLPKVTSRLSLPALMREEPDALRALRNDPSYARPGGETHDEMAERVLAAFDRCVAAGGITVVVCHRKPIMTVLAHLLKMPHETIWRLAAAPGSLRRAR